MPLFQFSQILHVRLLSTFALESINWISRRIFCYDTFKHHNCVCTWCPLYEDNVLSSIQSVWRLSKQAAENTRHVDENSGTLVQNTRASEERWWNASACWDAFVWCTHISGVTNGLKHPELPAKSKLKTREKEEKGKEANKKKKEMRNMQNKKKTEKWKKKKGIKKSINYQVFFFKWNVQENFILLFRFILLSYIIWDTYLTMRYYILYVYIYFFFQLYY